MSVNDIVALIAFLAIIYGMNKACSHAYHFAVRCWHERQAKALAARCMEFDE